MNKSTIFSTAFLFFLVFTGLCFATVGSIPEEKQKTFLTLAYFDRHDYSIELAASLNTKVNNRLTPINNAFVFFTSFLPDSGNKLGRAVTNEKGKAVLKLKNTGRLSKDTFGNFNLFAFFKGDNLFHGALSEISIR